MKIHEPMQLLLSDCEQERKHSIKKYLEIKKHAQQSRTNFLYELASQHASKDNQTISNIILRMNRNEEMRNSYRRIKNATKSFCGSTDKILIHNDNDEHQEIISNEKEVIEKPLSEENKQKFTMAYSSPFLQQPLISLLQQSATSIAAKQIKCIIFRGEGVIELVSSFIGKLYRGIVYV